MTKAAPTTKQDATEALEHVLARAHQVFAYFYFRTWIDNNHPQADKDALIVLKDAALDSSLMSIRDLDSFLASSSSSDARDDDIVAVNFGFQPAKNFLSKADRDGINKKLAHLTCQAGRELRVDPDRKNPRTWPYADLVNRTMKPFLEFIDHLKSSGFPMTKAQEDLLVNTHSSILINLRKLAAVAKADPDSKA